MAKFKNGLTTPVVTAMTASSTIGLVHEGGGLSSLTTDACFQLPRCTGHQPVGVGYGAPRWGQQIGTEAPIRWRRADDRDQAHGHKLGTFCGPRHACDALDN